ncbi:O-antigen ligase family protein [Fodinicola acaciae]|uniref:O-antigen ligase family protein n=1 Tax=Fodinicola acaciae TaxID=2681555 RepID=UPI001C9E950E|nr:O-antigen ligase family protein [Fodinicola acaciae]
MTEDTRHRVAGRAAVIGRRLGIDRLSDPAGRRWDWWVPLCLLAIIVASDYKFRLRPPNETVGGNADPFVLAEIAIYLTVGAFCVLRYGRAPRPTRSTALVFFAYAFVAVLVLSATYAPYPQLAVVRAAQLVVVVVLTRCIAKHAGRDQLHWFAHAFAVLVAGSVVFGVAFPLPHAQADQGRFSWLFVHPVMAGVFLGIATTIVVGYLLGHRAERPGPRWHPVVYLVLLAIVGGGLVATQTRGAVLGAVVGLTVLGWSHWRGRRKIEITLVGAVFAGLLAVAATPAVLAFFERGETASKLATLNSRTDLWAQAWQFFLQKPLYGWGLESTRGLFLDTIGLGGGHNALVNLLVDGGLVAAGSWIALIVTLVVTLYRIRASVVPDRAMLLGLVTFLLVDGMFVESLGAAANVASTWLFVIVAWAEILRARSEPVAAPERVAVATPVRPR